MKIENGDKKARELAESKQNGKIVFDTFEDGIRFIIVSLYSHFTAYIGVPDGHPLSGFNYDDIPVRCHGGLTFSAKGNRLYPAGFWWYGWDYAHCDDLYYSGTIPGLDGKDWTLQEVYDDSWGSLYDFKILMKLAELIKNK